MGLRRTRGARVQPYPRRDHDPVGRPHVFLPRRRDHDDYDDDDNHDGDDVNDFANNRNGADKHRHDNDH
jgi:hypothetical protein